MHRSYACKTKWAGAGATLLALVALGLTFAPSALAVPPAPKVTGVTPASPANNNSPKVIGSAEAGTTVKVYSTSSCTGSPLATGTAAAFASPGLAVSVADNTTTTFRATATNGTGTSSCSTTSVTYVEDSKAPAAPILKWSDPVSPGATTMPKIGGTAEAGSTVKLYANPTCTGSPAATGTAAAFASPGLAVTVSKSTTTTFRATATDAAGNSSSCSAGAGGSIAYLEDAKDILFEGQHVNGELFYLQQCEPGRITEVPDPLGSGQTVMKFTVFDSDVESNPACVDEHGHPTETPNPRAEAITPAFLEAGAEVWLHEKFLIPAGFPYVTQWMVLSQIFGPPTEGSPPWAFYLDGEEELEQDEFRYQRNATYKFDIPWSSAPITGSWVDLLLHIKYAKAGWVEMWFNGSQVTFFGPSGWYNPDKHPETQKLEMETIDESNDEGPGVIHIGQYRKAGMFEVASTYFQFLKVGTTSESVGG
jgi:hypothetical protein